MMKYEDASWHVEGDYPDGLDEDAAATHIGMLLAWCVLNGHASEEVDASESAAQLKKRTSAMTPGKFCLGLDGKLTDEDVKESVREFLEEFTDAEDGEYYELYEIKLSDDLSSFFHVPDSWDTYDVIAPEISRAFREFQEYAD